MPDFQHRPAASAPSHGPTTTGSAPVSQGPANSAVASEMATTASGNETSILDAAAADFNLWADADCRAVQRELKRLDVYHLKVDGDIGKGSKGGLRTIFGNNDWKSMTAADVLAHLTAIATPGTGQGEDVDPVVEPAGGDDPETGGAESWSEDDAKAVQRELKRLGLYTLKVDGDVGKGSRAALVEAFGSDRWQTMAASKVLVELQGATPPESTGFRYGEMFKDGVLDMTVGVGFDEGGYDAAVPGFKKVLEDRGFKDDAGAAANIYKQAGRTLETPDFGSFYVKKDAISYTPPVGGEPSSVHAVVRLVASEDGSQGKEAAGAFSEGMAESDVAYYSGHGRYGSGPDFDKNFEFELRDEDGNVEQFVRDYHQLQDILTEEGKPEGRGPWAQFLWRDRNDRITVLGDNEGNVFLNDKNQHGNEFGSKLMYWNLAQKGGAGADVQTGEAGALAPQMDSDEARDYRILVFDGCRTKDYVKAVRGTPGLDKNGADVLATTRTVNWGDEIGTLAAFLDGIVGQTKAKDVIEGMDDEQGKNSSGKRGDAYQGF